MQPVDHEITTIIKDARLDSLMAVSARISPSERERLQKVSKQFKTSLSKAARIAICAGLNRVEAAAEDQELSTSSEIKIVSNGERDTTEPSL